MEMTARMQEGPDWKNDEKLLRKDMPEVGKFLKTAGKKGSPGNSHRLKMKDIKNTLSFLFLTMFLVLGPAFQGIFAQTDSRTSEYVAYYFYTSKRCGPCTRIEQWSEDAIKQNFKEKIRAGDLEWRAINVDKPENRHFINDFKLYTKSVIVAEYSNGKAVRWKHLKKVWNLFRDREKYFNYVVDETRQFMEQS